MGWFFLQRGLTENFYTKAYSIIARMQTVSSSLKSIQLGPKDFLVHPTQESENRNGPSALNKRKMVRIARPFFIPLKTMRAVGCVCDVSKIGLRDVCDSLTLPPGGSMWLASHCYQCNTRKTISSNESRMKSSEARVYYPRPHWLNTHPH